MMPVYRTYPRESFFSRLSVLRYAALVGLAVVCPLLCPSGVFAQLNMKLVAVNPTDETKEIEVKQYMPKELELEDILETGDLQIEYDVNKGAYYAYGNVSFAPKESRTFNIKVNDVWQILPEEIDILKKQLENNLEMVEDPETRSDAESAKQLIDEELDAILAQQAQYSENIGRRIEQYRANAARLEQVRDQAYNLSFLEREAKSYAQVDRTKTVKFTVEVENPLKEEKTLEHKHFLPKEVRMQDVVEKNDFEVRFDDEKGQAYLGKEETLEPGEKKSYTFVIRDVWQLPLSQMDSLQARAEAAMLDIKGSVYDASGQFLLDAVMENLTAIRTSQGITAPSVRDHIARYRGDVMRYEQAKSDVEKLEEILAVVRAKKLEDLESSKVKNVLQKLRALRGLQALSQALFKKGISVTMTWRIIFGTLTFIAVFTTFHFFLWAKRSKNMGEELYAGDIKPVPKPGDDKKDDDE